MNMTMQMKTKTMNASIVIDEDDAEAKVYKDISPDGQKHLYLVKVSFPQAGFFISGITVQQSPKYPDQGLWVQMPRYPANGKWITPVELDKSSDLWRLIERLARRAVEDYGPENKEVYIPTEYELENINETVGKGIDDRLNELKGQPP